MLESEGARQRIGIGKNVVPSVIFRKQNRFFIFSTELRGDVGAFVCRNTFHHKEGRSTGVQVWEAGCMKGDKCVP